MSTFRTLWIVMVAVALLFTAFWMFFMGEALSAIFFSILWLGFTNNHSHNFTRLAIKEKE